MNFNEQFTALDAAARRTAPEPEPGQRGWAQRLRPGGSSDATPRAQQVVCFDGLVEGKSQWYSFGMTKPDCFMKANRAYCAA